MQATFNQDGYESRRYQGAVNLANVWMRRTNTSRTGLARILEVDHSVLVRFLNGDPSYKPIPSRPKMVRILEQLLRICSIDDVVHGVPDCPNAQKLRDDDFRAFAECLYRLEKLRTECQPEEGLIRMGGLVSNAIHSSKKYRSAMATNCLGAMCCFIDKPDSRQLSKEMLEQSIERALRLQKEAVASVHHTKAARIPQCAIGYSGYVIANSGYYLDDDRTVRIGLNRLMKSTRMENIYDDGIWPNSLRFLNLLLEERGKSAGRWSRQFRESAKQGSCENIGETLRLMHFPEVEKRWESEEPGIVERLSGGRKFISIAFFLVLLVCLLFPTVSQAANIRIVGGELFENLRSMCQSGDLGGLTTALEGHLQEEGSSVKIPLSPSVPSPSNLDKLCAFFERNQNCGIAVVQQDFDALGGEQVSELEANGDGRADFHLAPNEFSTHGLLLVGRGDSCFFRPGDIDQNGRLGHGDSLLLFDFLFSRTLIDELPCMDSAEEPNARLYDLNGDSLVDFTDAVHGLLWFYVGGAPPVSGTECLAVQECHTAVGICVE